MSNDDLLRELGLDQPATVAPPKIAARTATQQCPYCAETILDGAIKCKHCGEFLERSERKRREQLNTKPAFNPGIAAVLSLVIPGAGQMYKQQVGNGLAWLLVTLIAYVALWPIGIVLHLMCIIGASMK